jgi:hypothetical protein
MQYTKVISAPWETPNPYVEWFDLFATREINNNEVILIEFNIPIASSGIIKWIGQSLSNPQLFDTVVWKLFVNDAPIRNYGSFTGQISTLANPTEVFVFLRKGDNIKFKASSITNVNATGRLKGWFWTNNDIVNW